MKREIIEKLHGQFEDYAHELDGIECWFARELQVLLGYTQWRNFEQVITKARTACANAGQQVEDHFVDISKKVDIGSGTQREIVDVALTRYACYLVAQNGDPKKVLRGRGFSGFKGTEPFYEHYMLHFSAVTQCIGIGASGGIKLV